MYLLISSRNMTDKINEWPKKQKWPNKLKSYLAGLVIASAVAGGLSSCDEKDWGFGIGKGEKTEQLATKSLADSFYREFQKFIEYENNEISAERLLIWPVIVERWPDYTIMIIARGPERSIVKMLDSGEIEFSYFIGVNYYHSNVPLVGNNLNEWSLQTTADYAKVYQELIDIFSAANAKKASQ